MPRLAAPSHAPHRRVRPPGALGSKPDFCERRFARKNRAANRPTNADALASLRCHALPCSAVPYRAAPNPIGPIRVPPYLALPRPAGLRHAASTRDELAGPSRTASEETVKPTPTPRRVWAALPCRAMPRRAVPSRARPRQTRPRHAAQKPEKSSVQVTSRGVGEHEAISPSSLRRTRPGSARTWAGSLRGQRRAPHRPARF